MVRHRPKGWLDKQRAMGALPTNLGLRSLGEGQTAQNDRFPWGDPSKVPAAMAQKWQRCGEVAGPKPYPTGG